MDNTDKAPRRPQQHEREASAAPSFANKSVSKAVALLLELGKSGTRTNVTELAHRVKLSRPTASRMLAALELHGFVDRKDNQYSLGWQIARLGRLADMHDGVTARVQPILEAYALEVNENLAFGLMRTELEFDLISEASGNRLLKLSHGYVGGQWPLHASATGKVALAELDDARIRELLPTTLPFYTIHTITVLDELLEEITKVRAQGYSELDGEIEDGLYSLGFPVRGSMGDLLGVLTINGPKERMKSGEPERLINVGRKVASELAAELT